jgi:hypothetical protein
MATDHPPPVTLEIGRALSPLPLLWARALDDADASVLSDLLTEDVVGDLTPATTKIGMSFPVLTGRDTVVPNMIGSVGPLDTMHMVSNITHRSLGDGWIIRAYALAQHYLPGEGSDSTKTRHVLMGNTWTVPAASCCRAAGRARHGRRTPVVRRLCREFQPLR